MHGPTILTRTLSIPAAMGPSGREWQYHGRSDRHSKVACWCILFDLLQHCSALRAQVADRQVAFGINHEMRDFRQNRKKNLDLVLCTPRDDAKPKHPSFKGLAEKYGIELTQQEARVLDQLPDVVAAPVGAVHLALEAKACMTEHLKARPRLFDELNSSHMTIHGDTDRALAVGFVMVNLATEFHSPTTATGTVTTHRQPDVTARVIEKIEELPRRSGPDQPGFDAMAIVVVDCANDGTPVKLVEHPPAPGRADIFHYDQMIQRVANQYSTIRL